jgi:hypothetical protein
MTRVQRPPIKADIGAETARLDEPLRRVVTWLAERLERAEPEFVDVAAMWLDVIADGRRRDDAALEAERTQRMLEQLVPSEPSEYHSSHFVGLPRTPIAQPIIRRRSTNYRLLQCAT